MDHEAINEAFKEMVEQLGDPLPGISVVNINQTIWRLNEAAMFLSRHIQYGLLEPGHDFPDEVLTLLPSLSVVASEVARLLSSEQTECLECLEEEKLGSLEDDDED